MTSLLSWGGAIFAFGLVVFVHELGHFIAARLVGVRVEKFFVGFDPWGLKIWSRRVGGTEYGIGLIPLGGYVKMSGQEDLPGSPNLTGADYEYPSKSVGQRMLIIVAGVVMNFATAIPLFILAYTFGVEETPAVVGNTRLGYPAEAAGIRRGDRIVSIDGNEIYTFKELNGAVAFLDEGRQVDVVVERDGRRITLAMEPKMNEDIGYMLLGVEPMFSNVIYGIDREARTRLDPPDALDRRDEFRIIRINGEPVEVWADVEKEFERSAGKPARFECQWLADGDGETFEFTLKPDPVGPHLLISGLTFLPQADVGPTLAESLNSWWIGLFGDQEEQEKLAAENLKRFKEGEFPLLVYDVVPKRPAAAAGIRKDDTIVSVNGVKPRNSYHLLDILQEAGEVPIEFVWKRPSEGNREFSASLTPARQPLTASESYGLWPKQYQQTVKYGILTSVRAGVSKAFYWLDQILLIVRGIFTGKVKIQNLSGPASIFYLTKRLVQDSLIGNVLQFLAILSVNLAVLNMLPLPILDGGHMLFLGLEKLKGRPVSERIIEMASYASLTLLLVVFVIVLYRDFFVNLPIIRNLPL